MPPSARTARASPLATVTGCLSRFAQAATSLALDHLLLQFERQGAFALGGDPAASGISVLGMGKLGAEELNYSSDIDLIVLFDREAPAIAGDDMIGTKFVRLTRQLVQVLSDITPEGYVFRTDLRLRPDPRATQVAISVEAAATYYENMGQNWERAAMIKARPCAGDLDRGEDFLKTHDRRDVDVPALAQTRREQRVPELPLRCGHLRPRQPLSFPRDEVEIQSLRIIESERGGLLLLVGEGVPEMGGGLGHLGRSAGEGGVCSARRGGRNVGRFAGRTRSQRDRADQHRPRRRRNPDESPPLLSWNHRHLSARSGA